MDKKRIATEIELTQAAIENIEKRLKIGYSQKNKLNISMCKLDITNIESAEAYKALSDQQRHIQWMEFLGFEKRDLLFRHLDTLKKIFDAMPD